MTLLALAVEQSRTSIKTINPKPQTLKHAILSTGLGFVDVRDVALAHSLALLDPRAKGRYILVSDCLNFLRDGARAPPAMALVGFAWKSKAPGGAAAVGMGVDAAKC